MVFKPVDCPNCDGIVVIKDGTTAEGKQARSLGMVCDRCYLRLYPCIRESLRLYTIVNKQ